MRELSESECTTAAGGHPILYGLMAVGGALGAYGCYQVTDYFSNLATVTGTIGGVLSFGTVGMAAGPIGMVVMGTVGGVVGYYLGAPMAKLGSLFIGGLGGAGATAGMVIWLAS